MNKFKSNNGRNPGLDGTTVCLTAERAVGTVPANVASPLTRSNGGGAAMKGVNLAGFLGQATPYERWPGPIHPKLRLAAIASGPIVLLCLPLLYSVLSSTAASLAEAQLVGSPDLGFLQTLSALLSLLLILDVTGLVVYIPMLVFTTGLREANADWHWVAFAEAVLGATHGFVIAAGLAILVMVAAIFCLAAIVALFALAAGSSN